MTPSTDLYRDFCAGIGPLQLGVVLILNVIYIVFDWHKVNTFNFILEEW